jgi:hypothetical protein
VRLGQTWLAVLVCGSVGGLLGYGIGQAKWPTPVAWGLVATLTYLASVGAWVAAILARGLVWVREVVQQDAGAASFTISFGTKSELIRFGGCLATAGMAYAVVSATAILVRHAWRRTSEAGDTPK